MTLNRRAGNGWQTLLADLSIILFMVTAAALSRTSDAPAKPAPLPNAEAVALYRAAPGAPPLAQWLEAQAPDSRQRLAIVVPYRSGEQLAAAERAAEMLRQAGAAGANARIVIEPGAEPASVTLAFDATLARTLPERQDNKETAP